LNAPAYRRGNGETGRNNVQFICREINVFASVKTSVLSNKFGVFDQLQADNPPCPLRSPEHNAAHFLPYIQIVIHNCSGA
jgi:hypothetical protein